MRRVVPGAAAGLRRLLLPLLAVLLLLAVVGAALWRAPIARPALAAVGAIPRSAVPDVDTAHGPDRGRPPVGAIQRFDVPDADTPFAVGVDAGAPGRAPELIAGGPTGAGQAMRLAFDAPVPSQNSIAFDRTDVGAFDQVVVDF